MIKLKIALVLACLVGLFQLSHGKKQNALEQKTHVTISVTYGETIKETVEKLGYDCEAIKVLAIDYPDNIKDTLRTEINAKTFPNLIIVIVEAYKCPKLELSVFCPKLERLIVHAYTIIELKGINNCFGLKSISTSSPVVKGINPELFRQNPELLYDTRETNLPSNLTPYRNRIKIYRD